MTERRTPTGDQDEASRAALALNDRGAGRVTEQCVPYNLSNGQGTGKLGRFLKTLTTCATINT